MESTHLGDALDHWKGSIIQRLLVAKPKPLLKDITIVPMITDPALWKGNKRLVYSRLLIVKAESVSVLERGKEIFNDRRNEYFSKIPSSGDLFLDPDTGVSRWRSTSKHEYVALGEIEGLLEADTTKNRVIMVYHHAGRAGKQFFIQRVETLKGIARDNITKHNLYATTYNCTQAAMFFFSYNKNRIKAIETYRKTILPDN